MQDERCKMQGDGEWLKGKGKKGIFKIWLGKLFREPFFKVCLDDQFSIHFSLFTFHQSLEMV
ncbi:MAG: hypothetical protein CVV06_03330 [Gammaproteobacteria bacterium HGW-Gammaproteobacteria-10]|nr:MAG: hypothetical protein CVV06_03330 [Gammaproteobacteria bacterium HGW-Gammaproteobacteria-10]